MPFPSPGDLPKPETEPTSPGSLALASGYFTTEPPGKSRGCMTPSEISSETFESPEGKRKMECFPPSEIEWKRETLEGSKWIGMREDGARKDRVGCF